MSPATRPLPAGRAFASIDDTYRVGFITINPGNPVSSQVSFEVFVRPDRGWGALPTNDGLTLVVVGWPADEATAYRADVEGNFLKTLDLSVRAFVAEALAQLPSVALASVSF